MKAGDIIEAYRNLLKIEESFKLTKSCLDARPVFVRTKEHIEAHFLICYIALTIARIMQIKTKDKYSVQTMLSELGRINGSLAEENRWLFDYRSDITDALFKAVGIDHPVKWMTTSEVKKLLSKKKS